MMRCVSMRWLLLVLLCLSCSRYGLYAPQRHQVGSQPARDAKVRFGLLADSQFQTRRPTFHLAYASPLADKCVGVALRPPALDLFADELLYDLLDQLKQNQETESAIHMLLYLGDGANNGCQDELLGEPTGSLARPGLLQLLEGFRQATGIPVFFVIGNHDYLGNGNSPRASDRALLCGRGGRPLSKYDLMRQVSGFNRANRKLTAFANHWQYRDNLDAIASRCQASGNRRQHQAGCFFASELLNRELKVEVLLTDTSDYRGLLAPRVGVPGHGELVLFGTVGSISGPAFAPLACGWSRMCRRPQGLQLDWFDSVYQSSGWTRVVASHYPSSDIRPLLPPRRYLAGRRGEQRAAHERDFERLLQRDQASHTCWFSAHAHSAREHASESIEPPDYWELNIGSTTDGRPRAVIAACDGQWWQQLPVRSPELCKSIETEFLRRTGLASELGVNGGYKYRNTRRSQARYREKTQQATREFLEGLCEQNQSCRRQAGVCLALRATRIEGQAPKTPCQRLSGG